MIDFEDILEKSIMSTNPSIFLKRRGSQVKVVKLTPETRPFIFWDGEGITVDPETRQHNYVLFGSSNGYICQNYSLSTVQCFELLIDCKLKNFQAIHLGFGFNYDVEMITRDIPSEKMVRLYNTNRLRWGRYNLQYIRGKIFQLSSLRNGKRISITIYDIYGFFQTSLLESIKEYLDPDVEGFAEVVHGKGRRSDFTMEEVESLVKPYWRAELKLMVKLADKLREHLWTAQLPISSWHGPGAIASSLFQKYHIEQHMSRNIPSEVAAMGRMAFSGGRFEPFRLGRANCEIHVNDINSAHPSGIAQLPSLTGKWYPVTKLGEISDFGVYRISYRGFSNADRIRPHPFFYRNKMGCVSYPITVEGCYWSPELLAASRDGRSDYTIIEGWELDHDGSKPFSWVHDMYQQRLAWKDQGINAQWALKLALNSLFGKTAQRVGWEKRNGPPRWHQLEWGGYITSHTRALLWPAILQAWDKGSIVSCDTDAVISTEPLDLPVSKALGGWDYKKYTDMIYLQNGIYFMKDDKNWKWKFRGLDNDSLKVETVLEYLSSLDLSIDPTTKEEYEKRILPGKTTRFIGGRMALKTDVEKWRTWQVSPHNVNIGLTGKRVHRAEFCYSCQVTNKKSSEEMHWLTIAEPYGGISYPHHIPWIEEDSAKWEDQSVQELFVP